MTSSRIKPVEDKVPRVAATEIAVDQAALGPAGAIAPIPGVSTPVDLQRLPPAMMIAAVPGPSVSEPG